MRRIFLTALLAAVVLSAGTALRAEITINTQFAGILTADGVTGISAGRIGVLVADQGAVAGLLDPFGTVLQVGNFLGGGSDDRIIGVLTSVANAGGTGVSGFQGLLPGLVYDGNFAEGDALYIVWFPTISSVGATVGSGVSYGAYRSDVPNAASGAEIAFIAPEDGSTSNLFANRRSVAPGSAVTAEDFTANFVTVPEPSVLWLLGAAALGGLAWRARKKTGLLVIAGVGGWLFAPPAQAQVWKAAGTADWFQAANWEDGLPQSGDNTYFGNGGTAQIGNSSSILTANSFGSLNIGGSAAQPSGVHVTARATLDAHAGDIRLGYGLDPALQAHYGDGNLSVTGIDARVINAGHLAVGTSSPDGSQAGAGHLLITGGGNVTSTGGSLGHATLGMAASGSTATITGAGSKWTTGGLIIGRDAVLTVETNGELELSSGSVLVGAEATVTGNGRIRGAIALQGTISTGTRPDTLSTGSQSWEGGGSYRWLINDASALAGPGAGWSLLAIDGTLQINGTALNPFEIDLHSLTGGGAPGEAGNFSPSESYSWTIATATGGIGAFTDDQIFINTTGFMNPHPGRFRLVAGDGILTLNYTAVPEMSATGIASAAVLAAAILFRRRARAAALS